MTIDEPILIDLKKFGGEGFVEMMEPALSALRKKNKYLADELFELDENGNLIKKPSGNIDAVYMDTLFYVESAPFKADLDSFFEYTDMLDKKKRGNGAKLFAEMTEAARKIKEGEGSPSAGSPEAESGSSA